ncbi:hypothetical protein IT568_13130 [bacterium]|nr:hypothetical protein [bacterium]
MLNQKSVKFKFFGLILLTAIFCFGCDDDSTETNVAESVTKIEGKLPNWTYGSGKELGFGTLDENNDNWVSFGSSVIGSDGSFSITLGTPPDSLLELTDDNEIKANPADTKICADTWLVIFDETDKIIGVAYYGKFANDSTDTLNNALTGWLYATKNATFNGVDVWDEEDIEYTENVVNLSVKSGWSKFYVTITKLTTTAATITYTATAPAGLGWNFEMFEEEMPSLLQNHRGLAGNFKCLKKPESVTK